MGLVQVHLRRGQLALLRALAKGELASLVGPFAIDLDHTLRLIDFPRAVPAIEAMLPAETFGAHRPSGGSGAEGLSRWLLPNGRVGSNAFVLSGDRTTSGRPITPLLRVLRAERYAEFRSAFEGWAVSGQTFLYAGADGSIGRVLAPRVPDRTPRLPSTVVDRRPWSAELGPMELPARVDPPEGYIVSANDRPERSAATVGTVFSGAQRVKQLHELLAGPAQLDLEAAMGIQGDTVVPAARVRARELCEWGREAGFDDSALDAICCWDGSYRASARGALAYETVLAGLFEAGLDEKLAPLARLPVHREIGLDLVRRAPDRTRILSRALDGASGPLRTHERWGELSDLDATYFVLLGGQDGRLRSEAFDDQVDLWRRGRYLRLPMTPEAVKEHYAMKVVLRP